MAIYFDTDTLSGRPPKSPGRNPQIACCRAISRAFDQQLVLAETVFDELVTKFRECVSEKYKRYADLGKELEQVRIPAIVIR